MNRLGWTGLVPLFVGVVLVAGALDFFFLLTQQDFLRHGLVTTPFAGALSHGRFIVFLPPLAVLIVFYIRRNTARNFDDRLRQEAQLRERLAKSEERLRQAVELTELGTWDWDVESGTIEWSEQSQRLFGFPQAELDYKTYLSLVHPEDRRELEAQISAALNPQGQGIFQLELRIVRTDGSVRWQQAQGRVDFRTRVDGKGLEAHRVLGTVIDVTDRKTLEMELLQKNDEYRQKLLELDAVYRLAPVGLGILDEKLTICRANAYLANIARQIEGRPENLTPNALIGRPIEDFLPPGDKSALSQLRRTLETGEAIADLEIAFPGLGPGGDLYTRSALQPLRGTQGEVKGIQAVVQDVTPWKKAEEAVRANAERYRIAVEIAGILIYEWDLITNKVSRPLGLREVFGASEAPMEVGPDDWMNLIHPDDLSQSLKNVKTAIESGDRFESEYRVAISPGVYTWVWDRGHILRDSTGKPLRIVGIAVNIDARKQLEEQLRRQAIKLEEADKRKDEFIAMLSHELRNPLTPIKAAVETMRRFTSDPEARQAHELLGRQVDHMSRIVDDLLDVSRVSSGKIALKKSVIDLGEVVRHVGSDYRQLFVNGGLSFACLIPFEPVWMEGDSTRLAQAFGNLLHNALKFTPAGGSVEVRVDVQKEEKQVTVRVEDNGPGIREELIPYVFDTFVQANQGLARTGGGLGLGLPLVKGVVELHGGKVSVASGHGKPGATFFVTLPLVEIPSQQKTDGTEHSFNNTPLHSAESVATDPKPLAQKVLIIEDNPDSADGMKFLLQKLFGHKVAIAHDGPTGIQTACDFNPDIVLCDIGLPGSMDGYAVAQAFRQSPQLAHVRLVAFTGYARAEDKRRALAAGFELHLAKPPDLKDLRRVFG